MKSNPPIIIKLGGSVITNKRRPLSTRKRVIKRLGLEIKKFLQNNPDEKIILVHGGGSFGHPLAKKFIDERGYFDDDAFVRIIHVMRELNQIVCKILIDVGLQVYPIQTSCVFRYERGGLVFLSQNLLEEALNRNLTPLLHGDIVICDSGYTILSGDTIVAYLAKSFGSKRVFFVTDVSGIFLDFEKKKIIRKISIGSIKSKIRSHLPEIPSILEYGVFDVTGGIRTKLVEFTKYGQPGLIITILNGLKPGNLYKSLSGHRLGTRIIVV